MKLRLDLCYAPPPSAFEAAGKARVCGSSVRSGRLGGITLFVSCLFETKYFIELGSILRPTFDLADVVNQPLFNVDFVTVGSSRSISESRQNTPPLLPFIPRFAFDHTKSFASSDIGWGGFCDDLVSSH